MLVVAISNVDLRVSIFRWELVHFSMPVRLNLVEASSGRKVAALQGNWDVPCLKGEGCRNHKDRITFFDRPSDSLWQRLVVASGMKEADRHRRNRCIASQMSGGG